MRALKCDRCGKLYEFYNVERKDAPIEFNTLTLKSSDIYRNRSGVVTLDLCIDCAKSLKAWVACGDE